MSDVPFHPSFSEPPGAEPPGRAALRAEEVSVLLGRLIEISTADPVSFDGRLIQEMLLTVLKLTPDGRDTGELKLLSRSLKELRHAYRVFARYPDVRKISIFGSARTPPSHPDYIAAVDFSRRMAERGWGAITGAGDGIMKAGHEGPGRASSFGLAIRLPFETTANTVIDGDSKLITFRYFFTRKLIFVSQAHAVAVFPGGFGTQDEVFEVLTLIQTGKSSLVPVVLVEGENGEYWRHWRNYIEKSLLAGGFISEEDPGLLYIAKGPADAVEHVESFYRNYHSSRYVGDVLVLRMQRRLDESRLAALNDEFAVLVREGQIVQRGAYEAEADHLDLPRLAFAHTKRNWGTVRRLIDRINEV